MRALLGTLLILSVYVLIYYRLLARHYYEQATQRKESTFGTLFSLPPYKVLPPQGRKYVVRYWMTLLFIAACIGIAASLVDFHFLDAGLQ